MTLATALPFVVGFAAIVSTMVMWMKRRGSRWIPLAGIAGVVLSYWLGVIIVLAGIPSLE